MLLPSTAPYKIFRASFSFALVCAAALVGLVIARFLHWVSARTLQDILFLATPALLMLIALCVITWRIGYEQARDQRWRYCPRCGRGVGATESPCPKCGAAYKPELLVADWESRLAGGPRWPWRS